jgi:hypothetical protein
VKEGLGLKPRRKGVKIMLFGLAGLAGSGENRYISRNLWFSYDRVLRVGPSGPALFYYLSEPDADHAPGTAREAQPDRPLGPGPNPMQVRQPK